MDAFTTKQKGEMKTQLYYQKKIRLMSRVYLFTFVIFSLAIIFHVKREKPTHTVIHDTIIQKSVFTDVKDSLILTELVPVLKKREGLALKYYTADGYAYIFYGHQVLPTDRFTKLDSLTADSVLWNDLLKCYSERNRLYRKKLKNDIYSLFCSGKLNCVSL